MTSSGELSATTKAQALFGLEVSGGKILAAWKREKKENGLFSTEHLRVIHHDFHHGFQHTKYIRRWDLTNKMKMVKNRVYNMAKYGEFTMKIDKEKNVDLTMKKGDLSIKSWCLFIMANVSILLWGLVFLMSW